jgi:transposase-like protein
MSFTRTRGKKGIRHPDPNDPPRRRANKRRGRGTYANDRPPIVGVVCRETKIYRYWVVEHADRATSREIITNNISPEGTLFFTDEAINYTGLHPQHATVNHGQHEWARDDDGDGVRGVHCNSCEGAGAALQTYLRVFRGVHKYFLAEYVATCETLMNAKRITPVVIRRMCFGARTLTPHEPIMILRLAHTPPLDVDSLLVVEYDGRMW